MNETMTLISLMLERKERTPSVDRIVSIADRGGLRNFEKKYVLVLPVQN